MEIPARGTRVVHRKDRAKRNVFVVSGNAMLATDPRIWLLFPHNGAKSISRWVSLSKFHQDYVPEKELLEKVNWKKEGF